MTAADATAADTLARHFDDLFTRDADPWGYRTRWYERRKRALMLACLPQERYARAFEPACANGELSAELAARCDRLLCSDGSAAAVAHARRRLAGFPHVDVALARLPADWPMASGDAATEGGSIGVDGATGMTGAPGAAGAFDLIVLSEIGYYLGDADLDVLIERAAAALAPGGTLLASHWRHPEGDYLRSGDAVHQRMDRAWRDRFGLVRLLSHEEADVLVQVWSDDGRSVARREGLRP